MLPRSKRSSSALSHCRNLTFTISCNCAVSCTCLWHYLSSDYFVFENTPLKLNHTCRAWLLLE
jgi:hypothetical protein